MAEQSDPVGFETLGKKKAAVYTQLALAYTHNRLLKYDPRARSSTIWPSAGPSQPDHLRRHLRKGVRFHNKPPVNGRG